MSAVFQIVKDENLSALVQLLEEFEASPEALRAIEQGQRGKLSESLRLAIWEKFPQIAKVRNQPGNEDSDYWLGKLFGWDWARIKLLEPSAERLKAMTEFAYRADDGPLVIGYPNVIKHFMKKYLESGGGEHRAEANRIAGLNATSPQDEYARLTEKESLIPIAAKGSLPDVDAVKRLMERRVKIIEEANAALAANLLS